MCNIVAYHASNGKLSTHSLLKMIADYTDQKPSGHYALQMRHILAVQPAPTLRRSHMPQPYAAYARNGERSGIKCANRDFFEVMAETLISIMFEAISLFL